MGQASRKLANRFRHSRRCNQGLRKQATHDAVRIPKDVQNIQHLVAHEGYDPLHAAYIAAQNLLSFFAESVSTFEEFDAYCDIVGAAEDAYMPGGLPGKGRRTLVRPSLPTPSRAVQLPPHLYDAVCTHRDQQSRLDGLPQQVDPGHRQYRPAYGTS